MECEDEGHFLFRCHALADCRKAMYEELPQLSRLSNELEQFKVIMNKPYWFGNFLYKMWHLRSGLIESVK